MGKELFHYQEEVPITIIIFMGRPISWFLSACALFLALNLLCLALVKAVGWFLSLELSSRSHVAFKKLLHKRGWTSAFQTQQPEATLTK